MREHTDNPASLHHRPTGRNFFSRLPREAPITQAVSVVASRGRQKRDYPAISGTAEVSRGRRGLRKYGATELRNFDAEDWEDRRGSRRNSVAGTMP